MRIVGIGVDATEIQRVVDVYERHPESFLNRVFTKREQEYCLARKRNMGESLAARWAAKEAALKALGVGWAAGVAWTDVEVVNLPSGAPVLQFFGGAKEVADKLGVVDAKISLTHCETLAIAYVTLSAND
ncbi:MAG: holo-ACP synthase [Thermoguttaceae bacterium]|nr:holo-ACP synthase [Thermoguttaceae bacterium]MBR4750318.1 holo-ACP synthase [Thermoguttaceae bacterium]MBR5759889.1 holo-ACP synthase [Thermoguttaceae bacterium]